MFCRNIGMSRTCSIFVKVAVRLRARVAAAIEGTSKRVPTPTAIVFTPQTGKSKAVRSCPYPSTPTGAVARVNRLVFMDRSDVIRALECAQLAADRIIQSSPSSPKRAGAHHADVRAPSISTAVDCHCKRSVTVRLQWTQPGRN